MKHSLQLKLLFSFMLVITVLLGGVLLGVSALIKEQTLAAKQQELIAKGTELADNLKNFYDETGSLTGLDTFLTNADSYLGARIWVLDASRHVINMSGMGRGPGWPMNGRFGPGSSGHPGMGSQIQGGMYSIIKELDPVFDGKVWTKTFNNPYYGEKMLVVAVPVTLANGQVGGAVLLHAPIAGIDAFLQHLYYYIGGAGLLAVLLALLVVNYLTCNIVRPLKSMQETAGAMAHGDYNTLVKVETSDEVGRLGLALNSLARDLSIYIVELNKMEKLRRDFVANVSHELRTPLTIIRGYNEALLDGTINETTQIKKYYCLMRDEAVRMERLINDLLDLSRLQSAKVTADKEKIPLEAVADSVVHILKQQAEQKGIHLLANTKGPLPAIQANGDRIIQLLLILLDNAIKYTPSGGKVTITTFIDGDTVSVQVADTGVGIPSEDLPYIWERFYKVNKSHCRDDSGTGLGLAIAKQIIDLHQAAVTVTSQIGQGTIVTIRFPIV
ncbi:MAG: ATP-binding protein [Veillonellales bacterium]